MRESKSENKKRRFEYNDGDDFETSKRFNRLKSAVDTLMHAATRIAPYVSPVAEVAVQILDALGYSVVSMVVQIAAALFDLLTSKTTYAVVRRIIAFIRRHLGILAALTQHGYRIVRQSVRHSAHVLCRRGRDLGRRIHRVLRQVRDHVRHR